VRSIPPPLLRRGDDLAPAEAAPSAAQSIDATRTIQRSEPDPASAGSIEDLGDEAATKCVQIISDAADFVTMQRIPQLRCSPQNQTVIS
jgi:hypothetical protein